MAKVTKFGSPSAAPVSAPRLDERGFLASENVVRDPVTGADIGDTERLRIARMRRGLQTSQPQVEKAFERDISRAEREKDFQRGLQRGQQFFGGGALGRLEGLSQGENQAIRETRLRGLQRQQELQRRQLQGLQAQAGVQGGLAGQQLANLLGSQQTSQQEAEQGLTASLIEEKRKRDVFNLEQLRRELLGQQSFALGEQGFGIAERGGINQSAAAVAAAEAARRAGGGKK